MFYIDCAGLLVEIDNRYDRVEKISRGLMISPGERKIDIHLEVSDENIEFEKKITPDAQNDQLESLALLRKLAFNLPDYDAFLFHASVLEYEGKAYAFTARSGVGKTTHSMLWKKLLGDKMKVICGDKSVIRIAKDTVYAGATPWRGKEGYGSGGVAPLQSVAFINRLGEDNENKVELCDKDNAFTRLMTQTIVPPNERSAVRFLSLLEIFIDKVDFFDIYCDMSDEAGQRSIKALAGKETGR